MKRAFVILFGLLLIGGQDALVFSPQAAERSAACHRCHCGVPGCCVTPVALGSPRIPATQTRQAQSEARATPDVEPRFLHAQLKRANSFFVGLPSVFRSTAVPLYERTCSYLI